MKDWTDGELGALLTETLTSHESLADPATARRIAHTAVPRRRWPAVLAAAATVAAVIVGTTYVVNRPMPTASVLPLLRGPDTYAAHKVAAQREVARLMSIAPVPDDATVLPGEPKGWTPQGGLFLGGPEIDRVKWFAAMLPTADSVAYVPEAPPGMKSVGGTGRGYGPVNVAEFYTPEWSNRRAYTGPRLSVQWGDVAGRTIIRIEVQLLVLQPRKAETIVPTNVTGIEIRRYRGNAHGPGRGGYLPTLHLEASANETTIRRTVQSFNELVPMPDPMPISLCPMGDQKTDRITFKGPDGVLTAQFYRGCSQFIAVFRDGRRLDQRLNPTGFTGLIFRQMR